MILDAFHGLCMAAADSVPGVSGGTVAFILGFYDNFIDALHGVLTKDKELRKKSVCYLAKLAVGWCFGMAVCVTILSGLFKGQIYFLSSLFIGLTLASIPYIAKDEKESMQKGNAACFLLAFFGAALVAGLTMIRTGAGFIGVIDFAQLHGLQYLYIFVTGMIAITAMVLPGISGSTILLISGVYIPAITAASQLLKFNLSVAPGAFALGGGILAGIAISIGFIRSALKNHRAAMVYFILGLMIGSLFAIVNGPVTMGKEALSFASFSLPGLLLGFLILFGLESLRRFTEAKENGRQDAEMPENERPETKSPDAVQHVTGAEHVLDKCGIVNQEIKKEHALNDYEFVNQEIMQGEHK